MSGTDVAQLQQTTIGAFSVVEHPRIHSPKGFNAAGLHCGIKRKRKDLGWIVCEVPASAAAVYTMNAFQAAPLKVTRESLEKEDHLQVMLVNSGNANACTGPQGEADAYRMRRETAELFGISEHLVGVASTGVIGELLPMDRISAGLRALREQMDHVRNSGHDDFAEAILTTDTCTKAVEVVVTVEGQEVRIAGVAKGSGMIHPNMATMLAFLTTDAVIEPAVLRGLLREVTDETFNMITVDGDCSTNDMVVAMASGLAAHPTALQPDHPDWPAFRSGFAYVCRRLAQMIARDGEGATKLVEVTVSGAPTQETARQAAKAVVGSNLVKSAVFGADPNWGRILCAVGYGAPLIDPVSVDVKIGEISVVKNGLPVPFDEEAAQLVLAGDMVKFHVELHQGEFEATAWGCDLTYEYVRINACYRT